MDKAMIHGYKVFNPDWTCRDKKYTCPGVFEEDVNPVGCSRGMHFCKNLVDCFNYYGFNLENKVAEVAAPVQCAVEYEDKCVTSHLEIIREISWTEVLEMVNTGNCCTGIYNEGNWNTGDWNSGNLNSGDMNGGDGNSGNMNSGNFNTGIRNSGNRNSGNRNSGNRNTGNHNTGGHNSGHCNSGSWNSGNRNSGNFNSGDWNKCSFSNGCFNTVSPKIFLFNKLSDWTYLDWLKSDAYCVMKQINNFESITVWWKCISESQKAAVKSIPNFDKEIFKEITGIDVDH